MPALRFRVMDPPSPSLIAALQDLRLAGPRDLRRAARHCRLLARDLPAFDSVWIDALVRLRRLTLFQARELQDGRVGRLRIADYVLRDPLGAGLDCDTFLARRLGYRADDVLKEILVPIERRADVQDRLRGLIDVTRGVRSAAIIAPDAILAEVNRLAIVSRRAAGFDARAGLIRQGRFPASVVVEIARSLSTGVAELHRRGIAHGDIQAGNLRLGSKQGAVLVDAGVRDAVAPVLSFHESRSPHSYEGAAPERIGTGAPSTAATDVYALGCLLWHLLAGRPPFPTGDALSMLAAHRSRPLPSIRDFAPDTPPLLVDLIDEATRLDPASRPSDLDDWAKRFRSKRIAVRLSPGGSSRVTAGTGFPWPIAATALLALGGIGATLADRGTISTLLSIDLVRQGAINPLADRDEHDERNDELAVLPAPDEQGVISLEHAGPFAVSDIEWHGSLVLRGRVDRPATLVVTDKPFHLRADEITLEHVHVVHRPTAQLGTGLPAMLLIESQNLAVRACRFETPIASGSQRKSAPAGLAWRLIDRNDPTAGRLVLEDSVSRGVRDVLFLADPPRRVRLTNVLALETHSLLSLRRCGSNPAEVSIERTTVREADTVVRCGEVAQPGAFQVSVRDTVLDLAENGSLFTGPRITDAARLHWDGSGTVTSDSVRGFAATNEREPTTDSTNAETANIVGVTRAIVEFAGPPDGSDAASVATVRGVPRPAGQLLGVDLSKLPPRSPVSDASR